MIEDKIDNWSMGMEEARALRLEMISPDFLIPIALDHKLRLLFLEMSWGVLPM